MGTRATTAIIDTMGQTLVMLYRSHDGYVDGHGSDIVRYLKGKIMVNGYNSETRKPQYINGIWELGTRLIAALNAGKDEPGVRVTLASFSEDDRTYHYSIYLKQAEGTKGDYFSNPENTRIFLRCEKGYRSLKVFFDCDVNDLDPENMPKEDGED